MNGTTQRVLPVEEESAILSIPSLHKSNSTTAIRHLSGIVGDATDLDSSSGRDVVAPLPSETILESFHSTQSFLDKPTLVKKTAAAHPPRLTQRSQSTLKKAPSVNAPVAPLTPTTAAIRAKQLAAMESKQHLPKHSRMEKAAYRLDLYISTRIGQTISLTIVGLILVILAGILLKMSQPSKNFDEMVWESWTFLADPGSHTTLTVPGLRFIGIMTTMVGILYFSVIMGFVVDGIRDKMDNLKKGKSKVAEEGHTLILGWTDKSISLIRQICLANASEKGGVIVVLAENEKEDLEAELESHLPLEDLHGSTVIFRTGTPLLSVDLLKVAAHRAKSIIIMANSTGEADRSDAAVLRTVLSLKTLPELSGHIVAELRDIDNEPLVRLVGGEHVEILVSHDVIGRLVLMAARSPGLARFFSCLLGFDGNEFYFKEWPECVGIPFRNLSERFPDAIPLGIKRKYGEVMIFPNFDTIVESGDQIIVLAEDDNTYKACPPENIDVGTLPPPSQKKIVNERIMMCGWRRDVRDMIQLLDCLVSPGTELHMVCEEPIHLRSKLLRESGLNIDELQNLKMEHHFGNTAIRRHLEQLPLHFFTSIMILADQSRESDIMHSDSHSLASLLLIRDLQNRAAKKAGKMDHPEDYCKCISEILDPRTQRTISTSETILRLSEFIQSNELVSCILAMISESRDVRVILDELLGPHGAYFEVEGFNKYCLPSEEVSFWQLAKRAEAYGEILCGYQMRGAIDETVLNPVDKQKPRKWCDTDLVVLKSKDDNKIQHSSPLEVVHQHDFERTSQNRQGKSSFVRHQILEALVHEQQLATVDQPNVLEHKDTLKHAVKSFVELSQNENLMIANGLSQMDTKTVQSLITVSRMLADALEKCIPPMRTASSSDVDGDERVTEFDMNSMCGIEMD